MDIHLIADGDEFIAFHPPSLTLFNLNEETYACLKMLNDGYSLEEVAIKLHISDEELDKLMEYLTILSSKKCKFPQTNPNVVSRITLHVSNDCNLRCRYCYANGGSYVLPRKLMSIDTAEQVVTFIRNTFQRVGHIVFFGGEPFLNTAVIRYVCERFHSLYRDKKIDYLPKFGAVTNGFFTFADIFQLIESFFSFVTVSIDGDEVIHDTNRITANGQGSYGVVATFIEKLKHIPNLKVGYEATYTREHLALGYTRKTVQEYLEERFGITGIISDEYTMEQEAINNSAGDPSFLQKEQNEAFWYILPSLVKREVATKCDVGKGIFSISVDGDIYPCHMNTGEKNSCLGNVAKSNVFNSPSLFTQQLPYLLHPIKDNDDCNVCWAKNLCGGCTRHWFYSTQDKRFGTRPNQNACEANKKYIEKVLLEIARVRRSPAKWEEMISSIVNPQALTSFNV